MENDLKYFTPSIEDIRVGYEGEYHNWSMDEMGKPELNYNRWEKAILAPGNVKTMLEYGINGFRVPYLTKEAIETEGWEVRINKVGDYEQPSFHKEVYQIDLIKPTCLRITRFNQVLFEGECKSINEFRYIIKLIRI